MKLEKHIHKIKMPRKNGFVCNHTLRIRVQIVHPSREMASYTCSAILPWGFFIPILCLAPYHYAPQKYIAKRKDNTKIEKKQKINETKTPNKS